MWGTIHPDWKSHKMSTIDSNNTASGAGPIQPQKPAVDTRKRVLDSLAPAEPQPAATGSDELTLSSSVEKALETADFDSQKVERLRSAIAQGAYPLDSMKISEQFIELEKLI
jgi:flagellar biosynthesis anti-sigma factor FlgM